MQLDFDLRSAPKPQPAPEVMSVGAFTRRMRTMIEGEFGEVWLEGEASNVRQQSSGHTYFTLKDAAAQVACVLFAGQASQLRGVKIADGIQFQIFGQVSVYEQRGQYQIIVRRIAEVGAGGLQAKFDELKRRLSAEGLFDSAQKKALPHFPQRVGVVTSPTGAALRDFLTVLNRRQRGIAVLVYPVRVQGKGAALEIARGIRELANADEFDLPIVDVIVVTRGGGSLEDLWEFNEEVVARAIAESTIPVISAIGHEIDFTISDFVADVRAPTPSAAAELLSADHRDILDRVQNLSSRMDRFVRERVEQFRQHLLGFERMALYQAPMRAFRELAQTLDRAEDDLANGARIALAAHLRRLETAKNRMERQSPQAKIAVCQRDLARALESTSRVLDFARHRISSDLKKSTAVLEALSPLKALARGYSVTQRTDGRVVRTAAEVREGDDLVTTFADGKIRSVASATKSSA